MVYIYWSFAHNNSHYNIDNILITSSRMVDSLRPAEFAATHVYVPLSLSCWGNSIIKFPVWSCLWTPSWGSKVRFLNQAIAGWGSPVAEHGRVMGMPSLVVRYLGISILKVGGAEGRKRWSKWEMRKKEGMSNKVRAYSRLSQTQSYFVSCPERSSECRSTGQHYQHEFQLVRGIHHLWQHDRSQIVV